MISKMKLVIVFTIIISFFISIAVTIKDNDDKENISVNEFVLLFQSVDLPERDLIKNAIIGDRIGKAFFIRYEYESTTDFEEEIQSRIKKVNDVDLSSDNVYEKWRTYRTPNGAEVSFTLKDNKISMFVSTNGY